MTERPLKDELDWQEVEERYLAQICKDPVFKQLPGAVCMQIAEYCVDATQQGFKKAKKTV